MHRTISALLSSVMMISACSSVPSSDQPTLVIRNGRVWTANSSSPWAEAVAVAGDRIVAAGSNEDVEPLIGAGTKVIDARGRFVVPGFIDSHIHLLDGGFRLSSVQLRDARTREEFVRRIGEFAKTLPAGTWITGGDWDHELWGGKLPSREWIDGVTPDHPVWINRLDGHMNLANSAALRIAGVSAATRDVDGGTIVRDSNGEPTGIFKDNAMSLIYPSVPNPSPLLWQRALDEAMSYLAAQGVTSVHQMGSWEDLEVFRQAHSEGRLRTRIYAAVPLDSWKRLADEVESKGRGDSWLRIGALKGYVDGSLGSHTAAFFEPFSDQPADRGLLVETPENLYAFTSAADKAGLHVVVHAIGDRAINLQLGIFERVARENGERDRRFRIEHAQHIAPADMPRFARLEVIASMQPYHAIDDGRWAERVIGSERITTTYAFRSLLDGGARVAFGSDWFVAPPTPLEGIYAAVTRRTLDDRYPAGWVPEQKITVEQALIAYTRDAAYASFEEAIKGTIEKGKLADIVILDQDLTRIPPETIRDVKVRITIVGGKVVYERE